MHSKVDPLDELNPRSDETSKRILFTVVSKLSVPSQNQTHEDAPCDNPHRVDPGPAYSLQS